MQGKVEISGFSTNDLVTYSAEETGRLLRKSRDGNEEAGKKLVEGNLRLVLSVIQRFDRKGESPDDLFQVGCVGLMKAVRNFNPDMQVQFSTYGVPMIAGEVRRYLRDNAPIRVPRSLRDTAFRVLKAKETLTAEKGKEPTNEALAEATGLTVNQVEEALDAVCPPVSLYEPMAEGSGEPLTVMDRVCDRRNTEGNWLEHIALRDAFTKLPKRWRQVLSLRYYDGKTQMQVAGLLGISQAQVSRMEKAAVAELRRQIS